MFLPISAARCQRGHTAQRWCKLWEHYGGSLRRKIYDEFNSEVQLHEITVGQISYLINNSLKPSNIDLNRDLKRDVDFSRWGHGDPD